MNSDALIISVILTAIIVLGVIKLVSYLVKKELVVNDIKRRKLRKRCPNCGCREAYACDPIPYTMVACCNCKALLSGELSDRLLVVMDDATKRFPEIAGWWS